MRKERHHEKILPMLLSLFLLHDGCAARGENVPDDCTGIAERVQQTDAFAELMDVNEGYLEKYLLIDAEELSARVMRRDASRVTPEMILVLEVKASADQAAVRRAAEEYLAEQLFRHRDYQPAQVCKLENAHVMEKGAFIVLAVGPDAEIISATLGSGWK